MRLLAHDVVVIFQEVVGISVRLSAKVVYLGRALEVSSLGHRKRCWRLGTGAGPGAGAKFQTGWETVTHLLRSSLLTSTAGS